MTPLRVLITNNTLASRAGSELYVRDLALGLLQAGHRPIVYSTLLGDVATELRYATVPTIDRLDSLGVIPDVIHGHHHLETMTALLHFPGVPAIAYCHGWIPWEETPVHFPRIRRYVAVDETCRDRLVCENGISPEAVRLLLNFVDLQRFQPRPPLPDVPRRALVFSNYATEENYLPTVRKACQRMGIEMEVIGASSGLSCATPERVLGNYDLVFAKGRAALEALAVGASVILCDRLGSGPLVNSANYQRLRSLNFGLRTLQAPVTVEVLTAQIEQYSPSDAANVSQRLRAEASRDSIVEQLIELYREVREEQRHTRSDPLVEQQFASRYLQTLRIWRQECERQVSLSHTTQVNLSNREAELATLTQAGAELTGQHNRLHRENRELQQSNEEYRRQNVWFHEHNVALEERNQQLLRTNAELEEAAAQREETLGYLQREHARLQSEKSSLTALLAKQAELEDERDQLAANNRAMSSSLTIRLRNQLARVPGSRWLVRMMRACRSSAG